MPNSGHFWTPGEERLALACGDYPSFRLATGDAISYHGWRHRRARLMKDQRAAEARKLTNRIRRWFVAA